VKSPLGIDSVRAGPAAALRVRGAEPTLGEPGGGMRLDGLPSSEQLRLSTHPLPFRALRALPAPTGLDPRLRARIGHRSGARKPRGRIVRAHVRAPERPQDATRHAARAQGLGAAAAATA